MRYNRRRHEEGEEDTRREHVSAVTRARLGGRPDVVPLRGGTAGTGAVACRCLLLGAREHACRCRGSAGRFAEARNAASEPVALGGGTAHAGRRDLFRLLGAVARLPGRHASADRRGGRAGANRRLAGREDCLSLIGF